MQQAAASECDLVAEGRDMTTVVFPDALMKFYIDADVPERAKRRFLQLKEKGDAITMEQAEQDIVKRDKRDSSRDLAPLKKAEDAVLVDTSATVGLTLSVNSVSPEASETVAGRAS